MSLSPSSPGTVLPFAPPRTLDAAVAAWLLRYRGNPQTEAAYRTALRCWVGFCEELGLDPLSVPRPVVDAWMVRLKEQGRKPSTVAQRLAAVRSFYRVAVELGVAAVNPCEGVKGPRTGEAHVELTPGLTRDELVRVFRAAITAREEALVTVLALTALRISEALQLRWDHVGEVLGHQTVLVTGKGGRLDRVPFPEPALEAVGKLYEHEHRCWPEDSPLLLPGPDGGPWNRLSAARALEVVGRRAGLPRRLGPHQLRVTAITGALEAGAPLHVVQDFARHADPRTTQRYNRARHRLEGHATYAVAAWVAEGLEG